MDTDSRTITHAKTNRHDVLNLLSSFSAEVMIDRTPRPCSRCHVHDPIRLGWLGPCLLTAASADLTFRDVGGTSHAVGAIVGTCPSGEEAANKISSIDRIQRQMTNSAEQASVSIEKPVTNH